MSKSIRNHLSPVTLGTAIPLLAVALVAPLLLNEYRMYVACLVGVYAIGTLGLTVLLGHGGLISLGHSALAAVGAYTSGIVMVRWGLSFWLAVPLGTVTGAIVGGLLGIPLLRLTGPYLAVATFGFAVIVPEFITNWPVITNAIGFGDPNLFGGFVGLTTPKLSIGPLSLYSSNRFWYVVLAGLIVALVAAWHVTRSQLGLELRANRESAVAANAFGINTKVARVVAFAVSGAFAGLAGGLFSHLLGVLSPGSFGLDQSLTFVIIVVIGGTASIPGAVAGSFVVVVGQQVLTGYTSNVQLWYGLVLLLLLMFSRDGLAGTGRWLKSSIIKWTRPLLNTVDQTLRPRFGRRTGTKEEL